jgi:transcriptional regulator with XRE-family HTH domain
MQKRYKRTMLPTLTPAALIKSAREARGWSQAELARRVGISQPTVQSIETGKTRDSRHIIRVAQVLGLDISAVIPEAPPDIQALPLFAGGDAKIVMYGLLVDSDAMAPELLSGDTALVDPNADVEPGQTYVFWKAVKGISSANQATIAHLRRSTPTKWIIRRHKANDPDAELDRREWPLAHRVIGRNCRPS